MVRNARRSLQELSAEVATNPNSTAFVDLAAAYRERGDLKRALRLCLRGLERHPTHVEAHYELGRIYEARGDRELALDEWSVVRALAPDHVRARCASVRLYLEEGRADDARRELLEIRELAPEDATVTELWTRLHGGEPGGAEDGTGSADGFDSVAAEYPEASGILLTDAEGVILSGWMPEAVVPAPAGLAADVTGAREEAERVTSYLELGEWEGLVVEQGGVRLAVSPVGEGVLIVATSDDVPAGRASRVVERAEQAAAAYLEGR